jgi:hypothetical protein
MQELLQPPVPSWVMRGIHGVVILAQELVSFLLRQVPENDLRVIRILNQKRLGGHEVNLHRAPDTGL